MISLPIKGSDKTYTVNPTKIVALGLNYRKHIEESLSVKARGLTAETPKEPVLFPKTTNVLIGPDRDIIIPGFIEQYKFDDCRTDYEAELAIIIKDHCKNVSAEEAYNHILGYTCMNDVSQRNIQNGDRAGWYRGKSFDTFGPIGPAIVRHEDIGDPQNLNILCRLNGKTVQDSNTSHMIFPIIEIIRFVSMNFSLFPGDIIMTGTPAGIGQLHHNDIVEVEIENIGILKNRVIEERQL